MLKPLVSVIIPVLNASSTIDELMEALEGQTYPREQTEIFVIDNGSTDNTVQKAGEYDVTVLDEHSAKNPYAARNRGFESAGGTILALLDANKIPAEDWVEKGVNALQQNDADLAGGDIRFSLGDTPSISEVYDSMTFNNNKKLVEKEGGSAAGNLFVKREVVETVGPFPENFRSGMDIWWTQEAVRNGFRLIYAEDALVYCKPRKFRAVLKKSYRVGVTHPHNLHQSGKSIPAICWMILRTFAPPAPVRQTDIQVSATGLWGISWLSKIFIGFGRIRGLLLIHRTASN